MKSFLVPTINLARLIYRAVQRRKLPYNYCAAALDSSGGIYIQLGNAAWLPEGATYVNPHSRH